MRSAVAAVVLLAWAGSGLAQTPPEEMKDYAGRTFEQWLKDINHKDPSKRENAIRSVLAFGPQRAAEAVPAMLAELRRHTPSYPIDTSVRVNITIALGVIFGNVKDPDQKQQQEAITLLTRLLRDSQSIVKFRAAQALGLIGPEAASAMKDMLPLLRDFSAWEVRQAAATSLGAICYNPQTGPPTPVLNALYERIKEDPAFQVRLACLQSLAMAGASSDPAHRVGMLKVLDPILRKETEPALLIWAHMAMMSQTGKVADDSIEQIGKLLNKGDTLTRAQAAQAIGAVGVRAKDVMPALMNGLYDPDPTVQNWIIWAVSRMEGHATKAVPVLEKIAADPKAPDQIKKAAKLSIEQIKKAKSPSKEK